MSEIPKGKNHTLMLDARGKLMLTGAEDVSGFNEETVSVLTSCGRLIIKGERLHIDKLNLESGKSTNAPNFVIPETLPSKIIPTSIAIKIIYPLIYILPFDFTRAIRPKHYRKFFRLR